MREPTPTSQAGTRTGPEARTPQLGEDHPWERAIATVVEDTPPLVDNVYHRIAGDHPPGMARASGPELLDYWWEKLYQGGRLANPDPRALAELYQRAPENELKDLIAALRKREREAHNVGAVPEAAPSTNGGANGTGTAHPTTYSYP